MAVNANGMTVTVAQQTRDKANEQLERNDKTPAQDHDHDSIANGAGQLMHMPVTQAMVIAMNRLDG